MVNVTVTGALLLLIRVPLISPVPALAMVPVIAGLSLVQVYVVPLVKLDKTIGAILSPLHIAWLPGDATATGDGFTSTVAVTAVPGHPFAAAVIVNVTNTGFGVLFIKVPEILPLPLFAMVPVMAGLSLTQL